MPSLYTHKKKREKPGLYRKTIVYRLEPIGFCSTLDSNPLKSFWIIQYKFYCCKYKYSSVTALNKSKLGFFKNFSMFIYFLNPDMVYSRTVQMQPQFGIPMEWTSFQWAKTIKLHMFSNFLVCILFPSFPVLK